MAETTNARVSLASTDVAERTAAARDLATLGTPRDLPLVLTAAKEDRSPSVRLYAAGAAAEIAARGPLTDADRKVLLEALRTFDPGTNPSLVLVLAALRDDSGIERLGRLLRDPRRDVRTAAATAVRRMANLPGCPERLQEVVGTWLGSSKLPPDSVAELVRLTGECGWISLEGAVREAAGTGRAPAEAAELALAWLQARRDPTSWGGTWMTTDEGPTAWLYIANGRGWGAEGSLGELKVKEGIGTLEHRPALRRVWATRTAAEGTAEAITVGDHTLWRHRGNGLAKVVEQLGDALGKVPEVARGLALEMKDLEGVSAVRARAFALWMGGQLAEADRVLQAALAAERKPHPQSLWIRANVCVGLGDLDAARECARICVASAPKKAPYREDAEALLASLGGEGTRTENVDP